MMEMVYGHTYSFENNDGQLEYKYCIDNWASQENLLDDLLEGNGSCVEVTDYTNYARENIFTRR